MKLPGIDSVQDIVSKSTEMGERIISSLGRIEALLEELIEVTKNKD